MAERKGEQINWSYLRATSVEETVHHPWSRMSWACWGKYVPWDSRVLEIGCGTGRVIAQSCKQRRAWGVGLDLDPAGLYYARELSRYVGGKDCHFVRGDGFSVPFPDNSFNAVISEGVIEHFPPSQTEAVVREHVRVCKIGGRVIVSVPNLLNLPLTYARVRMGKSYPAYPERGYTIWGLSRLLRGCGLHPRAYDGYASTLGFEWYIYRYLRFHFVDCLIAKSAILSSLLGYMCLAVGVKEGGA
jgi:SAM-dependent methyltransferase